MGRSRGTVRRHHRLAHQARGAEHRCRASHPCAHPGSGALALALSGLATGLSWFCYNRALHLGPVAAVAALDKISVVLVALLAWLVLGEPLGLKAWIGVLTMAIGATLVAWA
ncbi:MAG: hypothetical protein RLZZ247_229 [Cyanobacteriota bacterium]